MFRLPEFRKPFKRPAIKLVSVDVFLLLHLRAFKIYLIPLFLPIYSADSALDATLTVRL